MRTDSTNLAAVAIQTARDLIAAQYGPEYLPDQPRVYATKVKNAQEAHEAIRPAGHPFELPEALRSRLSPEEFRLYDLVWKRTVASQMRDAKGRSVTITAAAEDARFEAKGTSIEFPGYLRAYVEGSDDPESQLAERESILPIVREGEPLTCQGLEPKRHATQPPNRFSEAALTRALEEKGIGRPSTYAAIIDTILGRNYVFKRNNVLVPTWTAFAVCQLLERHFPELVNYEFTAQMEEELDAISRGEMGYVEYLNSFYFGNGESGLKPQLTNKKEEIDARDVSRVYIGKPQGEGPQAEPIYVDAGGRFGPRIIQGDRRANIAEGVAPDEITVQAALDLLNQAAQGDTPLGYCPQTGKPVFLKIGRFGPYVQRGVAEGDEKPQNASLLKGMQPEQVDLPTALRLLSLPRTLGNHPQTETPVVAQNGRYGPYIKCGTETRTLPASLSPLDVTLAQALELLAQPKPGRGAGRRQEPLAVFAASPVTGQPVQLLAGRYGPYVTDGTTNASLPRDMKPEEATLEKALDLLANRAAQGPAKRRRGARHPARRRRRKRRRPGRRLSRRKPPRRPPPSARRKARNEYSLTGKSGHCPLPGTWRFVIGRNHAASCTYSLFGGFRTGQVPNESALTSGLILGILPSYPCWKMGTDSRITSPGVQLAKDAGYIFTTQTLGGI